MTDAPVEPVLRGRRSLWRFQERIPRDLREGLNAPSAMLAHLLFCRGYRTSEEIETFFQGPPVLHDPFLLPDMEPAVRRITRALLRGERVAIFGDFDCDGITATLIIEETLRGYGADPMIYLPERVDGHGLSADALALLRDEGIDLIVTADCGVNALQEVQVAQAMDMDVVVTDHHEARADGLLPNCPTVAPTRHDSIYPFRGLCGAGVAYKVAQALKQWLPGGPDLESMLDLVALGTVADVVPLRDENRAFVVRGLERLRRTKRPGMLALFDVAGVDGGKLDPISIGFYLAPRINAANRMASPRLAYELLGAVDSDIAAARANQLSSLNRQRQLLVESALAEVRNALGEPSEVVTQVLKGERPPLLTQIGPWPAGISGLLASKLAEAYGLPAFIGTDSDGETVAISVRGVPGIHIDEILEACEASLPEGLFVGYGGHARAAGFRVQRDRLSLALSLIEEEVSRQAAGTEPGSMLHIDAEIPLSAISLHAIKQVEQLAPFGMEFPEPLFLARDACLRRIKPIGGGRHARCSLQQGGTIIDGVIFHVEPEFLQLPLQSRLDVVFHVQANEWQDRVQPEMRLRDWRVSA